MSLQNIYSLIPDTAKDVRLNLESLLTTASGGLTDAQLWGSALAAAISLRQPTLLAAIEESAAPILGETNLQAAYTAASLMGMTNAYYRTIHHMVDKEYATMPARLRMNSMKGHGAPEADFDLWALASSVIGNCSGCINAHDKQAKAYGVSREGVQTVIRLASVLHATAIVLDSVSAASRRGNQAA